MIFAGKMSENLHNNCPKNIFPNFRGHVPPTLAPPPPPVSYAYACYAAGRW